MDKATQRGKILAYCAEHGSITCRDALIHLNMNSPRKRISELARMGYDVRKVWETRTNAAGETKRYLRYYISGTGGGQDGN